MDFSQLGPHDKISLFLLFLILLNLVFQHFVFFVKDFLDLQKLLNRLFELLYLVLLLKNLLFVWMCDLVEGDGWVLFKLFELLLEIHCNVLFISQFLLKFLLFILDIIHGIFQISNFSLLWVDFKNEFILSLNPLLFLGHKLSI